MDEMGHYFVSNVKKNDSCTDILNWYRNLYYTENDNTERGIVARAINDLFIGLTDGKLSILKTETEGEAV